MRLMIDNVPPDASDDDLRAFVNKYVQVDIGDMTHVDADGGSAGVLLDIPDADPKLLAEMQRRLNHVYWNGYQLYVHVMLFSE